MPTKSPKVHVSVTVSLADYEFIPGDEGHCPIAEALKRQDPDILTPKVTDKKIVFSRRSTDSRYTYNTPINAVRFIHAVDAILQTKKTPKDLSLVLTDMDLISVNPRTRRDNTDSLRKANTHRDVVRVENGKVIVDPAKPAKPGGHRPRRVNAAA